MLQERATASPQSRIPPNTLAHRDGANIDFSIASGARRGFEGLIATRGRTDTRCSTRSPVATARALASVPKDSVRTLQVGVADSRDRLEAADRLIRKRYAWRGYNLEAFEYQGLRPEAKSALREITFFAADQHATLGTITLRLDGPDGLRAESTHGEVVRRARGEGRCIGELTRLALAEGVDSRHVLASLFGLVYTIGRVQHGVTDVFIEVNPRHVVFYSRAIGFTVVGDARFCERVCAPSVLLHLDVDVLEEQLGLVNPRPDEAPLMRYGT